MPSPASVAPRLPPTRRAGAWATLCAAGRWGRTLVWSVRGVRQVRRQLRRQGLQAVRLPVPPAAGRGSQRGLAAGLRAGRASCLERSLVRQRWYRAAGRDVPILIGVNGSTEQFGAHAWLEGDPTGADGFSVILNWA